MLDHRCRAPLLCDRSAITFPDFKLLGRESGDSRGDGFDIRSGARHCDAWGINTTIGRFRSDSPISIDDNGVDFVSVLGCRCHRLTGDLDEVVLRTATLTKGEYHMLIGSSQSIYTWTPLIEKHLDTCR